MQNDATYATMIVETHFQMNYSTGEWKRIKKYRRLEEDVIIGRRWGFWGGVPSQMWPNDDQSTNRDSVFHNEDIFQLKLIFSRRGRFFFFLVGKSKRCFLFIFFLKNCVRRFFLVNVGMKGKQIFLALWGPLLIFERRLKLYLDFFLRKYRRCHVRYVFALLGSGCSTAVELKPAVSLEVVGSNPTGFWALFFFFYPL